jgi:hypothetical protein
MEIDDKTCGGRCRILGVFDGDTDTVVHESVHMALLSMGHIGLKVCSANEETLANLAGWLATEMMRCFPGAFKYRGQE